MSLCITGGGIEEETAKKDIQAELEEVIVAPTPPSSATSSTNVEGLRRSGRERGKEVDMPPPQGMARKGYNQRHMDSSSDTSETVVAHKPQKNLKRANGQYASKAAREVEVMLQRFETEDPSEDDSESLKIRMDKLESFMNNEEFELQPGTTARYKDILQRARKKLRHPNSAENEPAPRSLHQVTGDRLPPKFNPEEFFATVNEQQAQVDKNMKQSTAAIEAAAKKLEQASKAAVKQVEDAAKKAQEVLLQSTVSLGVHYQVLIEHVTSVY